MDGGEGNNRTVPAPLLVLLGSQDGILGRFCDPELDDFLGGNLDFLVGSRDAPNSGLTINQDQFTNAGESERVFGVLVGKLGQLLKEGDGLFFGESYFFG